MTDWVTVVDAAIQRPSDAGTLTIESDRYGLEPLYVVRTADRLFFSKQLSTLLDRDVAPRRLDRTALAEALAFGAPFGRRTLIEGIETFPPATRMVIDPAARRVDSTRTWDP